MAIMAKWRDKTFEVSADKVNPLSNFSTSTTIKSDNSDSKKNTTELVPFKFDVDIHANAGLDPKTEYDDWCSLISKTDILYLNGERFGRETRLKEVSLSGVIFDDFGRIRFATIGLSFEEVNQAETKSTIVSSAKKSEKKTEKNKGKKIEISVGSKVKLTGTYYPDHEKIPDYNKTLIVKVTKISGSKAYIAQFEKWVYLSTLSIVD